MKKYLKVEDSNEHLKVMLRTETVRRKILFVRKTSDDAVLEEKAEKFNSIWLMRVPLVGPHYLGVAGNYTMDIHKDYIQYLRTCELVLGSLLFRVDLRAHDLDGGPASDDWLITLNFLNRVVSVWDRRKNQTYSLDSLQLTTENGGMKP